MLRRITTALTALAALGALALGGSVIASANPTHHAGKVRHHVNRATKANAPDSAAVNAPDPAGDANAQSGDQTTPDSTAAQAEAPGGGAERSAEAPSHEADGPGGHQDPPGANVDNQQQGQN